MEHRGPEGWAPEGGEEPKGGGPEGWGPPNPKWGPEGSATLTPEFGVWVCGVGSGLNVGLWGLGLLGFRKFCQNTETLNWPKSVWPKSAMTDKTAEQMMLHPVIHISCLQCPGMRESRCKEKGQKFVHINEENLELIPRRLFASNQFSICKTLTDFSLRIICRCRDCRQTCSELKIWNHEKSYKTSYQRSSTSTRSCREIC